MSIHRTVWLYCDGDTNECPHEGEAFGELEAKTAAEIRRRAKQYGWVHRGSQDYCPDCRKQTKEETGCSTKNE